MFMLAVHHAAHQQPVDYKSVVIGVGIIFGLIWFVSLVGKMSGKGMHN